MPRPLTRAPAVAALPGQIDLTCQDRAFDQVHAAVARGAAVVVADFTATTFCDCSSMRALLAIGDMAAARGVQLRLAIPPASPVRRLAGLLGGDGRVPVYPGVREAVTAGQAAGPGGPPPPRQETPAMADITEVIAAHDAFIARWQATFTQLARDDGGPASGQARAAAWAELAVLIELHLDAEDEICGPALCRAGPSGPDRVRGMREAHDEVREIIREARLQPAGSPPWQQLTAAALAAWASLPGRGEHGILDDLRPRRGAAAAGQPGAGQGPGCPAGQRAGPAPAAVFPGGPGPDAAVRVSAAAGAAGVPAGDQQAKGIIMAQSRCGTTEAFDLLRRASQRSNVPVRDLAARARTARGLAGSRRRGMIWLQPFRDPRGGLGARGGGKRACWQCGQHAARAGRPGPAPEVPR